jgi:hypothetical protein
MFPAARSAAGQFLRIYCITSSAFLTTGIPIAEIVRAAKTFYKSKKCSNFDVSPVMSNFDGNY